MSGNRPVLWWITKRCSTCGREFTTAVTTELCIICYLAAVRAKAKAKAKQQRQRKMP